MKTQPSLTRHIIESVAVAIVLTGISYLVAALAGWITEINWLEFAAVFTSYSCTYLGVKQRRINYAVAVVTTSLYCVLFYQWGLLGSMVTQLYLLPTVIIGWFWWGKDSDPRPVLWATGKTRLLFGGIAAVVLAGALTLTYLLGGSVPPLDLAILALTIFAQLLMDRKKLDSWIVWAAVNIVAIYVYFTSGLYLAAFQYVFFLLNTVYGFQQWRASMTKPQDVDFPIVYGQKELVK